MFRAAVRKNQIRTKGFFFFFGKQLALGLCSVVLGASAMVLQVQAQAAQYNWKLTKGASASGGGSKLEVLVPPSNAPLGRFACVDNQGAGTYTVFTLAANVGALKSGSPAKVSISTPQGKHNFSGLIVEPATGGGIKGITFSVANNHPVWPAIANGRHFDYQVEGFTGSRLSLTSSNGTIGQFATVCGFSVPQRQANAVTPLLAPAPQQNKNLQPLKNVQQQPQQQPPEQQPQQQPEQQPQPQRQAAPREPSLSYYQTRPGRAAWGNTNYRIQTDGGKETIYTARLKNGGLAIYTYCLGGDSLQFFITRTRSGKRYPQFIKRIQQGLENNPSFQFGFENGGSYQIPMFLDSEGDVATQQSQKIDSEFVQEFLNGTNFSVINKPFGALFQLKSSKKAICKVVNRCGASSSICGGKSRASSRTKSRSKSKRCRSRSVYIAGRGCILKRYVR